MRASGWRPHTSGTLRGFFDLLLPSGLLIPDFTLHQQGEKRWIGFPGKAVVEDGRHRLDAKKTGKGLYTPAARIPDPRVRDKFTAQALVAVDEMLGQ
jgi:hypothetical protein